MSLGLSAFTSHLRVGAYILGQLLQLLAAFPPGDERRRLRSGTLALHVIGAICRHESILGKYMHGNRFHCRTEENHYHQHLISIFTCGIHSRFTSRMTTRLLGGVKFVLLATHISRELRCCLPTFGYDRWLMVLPSGRCSKDSSIAVLSKYQVTLGRGRPEICWGQ